MAEKRRVTNGSIATSSQSKRLQDAKANAKAIETERKREAPDVRVDELQDERD